MHRILVHWIPDCSSIIVLMTDILHELYQYFGCWNADAKQGSLISKPAYIYHDSHRPLTLMAPFII